MGTGGGAGCIEYCSSRSDEVVQDKIAASSYAPRRAVEIGCARAVAFNLELGIDRKVDE